MTGWGQPTSNKEGHANGDHRSVLMMEETRGEDF